MGRTRPGIVKQSYSYCWLKDAQRPLIGWTAVLENQLMRTHSCLVKERRWTGLTGAAPLFLTSEDAVYTSEQREGQHTHTPICLCIPFSSPKIISLPHSGYPSSLPLFRNTQFPLISLILQFSPSSYSSFLYTHSPTRNNVCQSLFMVIYRNSYLSELKKKTSCAKYPVSKVSDHFFPIKKRHLCQQYT